MRDLEEHRSPQMTRRSALRLLGTCALGLGLSCLAPNRALADPEVPDPSAVAQDVATGLADTEVSSALQDALRRYEEAKARLDALGAELERMTVALGETESRIAAVQANIAETERQVESQRKELEAAKGELARRMSASYKAGSAGMLDVVLGSASMEEFVSGVYYMDKVAASDRASIEAVEELKELFERQQSSLEDRRGRLADLRDQQEQQRREIEVKHQETQDLLSALDAEVKDLIIKRQEEVQAAAEAQRLQSIVTASDITGSSAELRAGVINAALRLLGVPYVFGGTYPESGGTDCSGLVQWAFAQNGVYIPRTTYTQAAACRSVGTYFTDASLLLPGDLVFCNKGGHVALYLGNGQCIHEPMPGDVCSIVPISRWQGGFIVGYGFPLPA